METPGLNVTRLIGMLERMKVESVLVEADRSQDHYVLRLTSVRRPGLVVRLEHINQGEEPRLACLQVESADETEADRDFRVTEESIRLRGSNSDDAAKIAEVVKHLFLIN